MHLNQDELTKTYCQWCVECAYEKWSENYLDFAFVIRNLLRNNKNVFDFGKISSARKNCVYNIIRKH